MRFNPVKLVSHKYIILNYRHIFQELFRDSWFYLELKELLHDLANCIPAHTAGSHDGHIEVIWCVVRASAAKVLPEAIVCLELEY